MSKEEILNDLEDVFETFGGKMPPRELMDLESVKDTLEEVQSCIDMIIDSINELGESEE